MIRRLWPFALMTLVLASACSGQPTTAPSDVTFDTIHVTIKGKPFTLEVADTDARRERGLMFRESMAADHGMLFVFESSDKYRFWMKNTLIPLDIVFLDAKGDVVDVRTMKAQDETPVGPDMPARFAIELNAKGAKVLGLVKGDHIPLPEKFLKQAAHSDDSMQ